MSAIRSMPADLAAVVGYVIVALVMTELVPISSVRAVVVTPLFLFVSGYTFVSAVYPARYGDGGRLQLDPRTRDGGLHPIERAGLSFGTSVALLPLTGAILWAIFGRFSMEIVLFGLVTVSLVAAVVASVRRAHLPPNERFQVPVWSRIERFRRWLVGGSIGRTAVNVFLVASLLIAAGALVYAFAVPISGESYTTAALVTGQDGEYVTSGYPTEFTAGEPRSMTLQLSNHERAATDYSVVVAVEVVEDSETATDVFMRSELDRFDLTLRPGETVRHEHDIAPETVGEDLRLSYYVYKDEVPQEVNAESAYRDLQVWISVEEP